jgi:predicted RNA-binding Zn ribbon-like protein
MVTKPSPPADVPRKLDRAGRLCLAFANTTAAHLDYRSPNRVTSTPPVLGSYRDLVEWSRRMGALEHGDAERLTMTATEQPEEAAAVFQRALRLRDSLLRIFTTVAMREPAAPEDLDVLNGAVKTALAARRIVQDPSFRWTWDDGPKLDRMLWPIALCASNLLFSADLDKVRQCAAKLCTRLFVGRARRRWCDMNTCGSRPKGKRHYEKNSDRRLRYQPVGYY